MIYFIGTENGPVKIWYTRENNLKTRLKELQIGNPYQLEILGTCEGNIDTERKLHERFAQYRKMGEWFERVKEIEELIATLEKTQNVETIKCLISEKLTMKLSAFANAHNLTAEAAAAIILSEAIKELPTPDLQPPKEL